MLFNKKNLKKIFIISLFIAYPFLVHFSIIFQSSLLQTISLCIFLIGVSLTARIKRIGLALVASLIILSIILSQFSASIILLYVPPIIIPIFIAIGFLTSLQAGREPIVTAIGEASRGPLSQPMRKYTKQVTQLWTGLLITMAITNFSLALIGNDVLWSFITSFLNYVIIIVVFISEFIYRKIRFKDHNHPSFIEYIKIVTTTNVDIQQPHSLNSEL